MKINFCSSFIHVVTINWQSSGCHVNKTALRIRTPMTQCSVYAARVRGRAAVVALPRKESQSPALLRAYKCNVCYGSFSRLAATPSPGSPSHPNPTAAQKTSWLQYLHPRLRGNAVSVSFHHRFCEFRVINYDKDLKCTVELSPCLGPRFGFRQLDRKWTVCWEIKEFNPGYCNSLWGLTRTNFYSVINNKTVQHGLSHSFVRWLRKRKRNFSNAHNFRAIMNFECSIFT
jgi:hypothetical protein